MKQFDKWWEHAYRSYGCDESPYIIGQDIWQAALEWVLNGLDYSESHKEIEDKIYEELQDERI